MVKGFALAALAMLAVATAAQAAPAERSVSDVWRFSNGAAVEGASSQLVRTDDGVSVSLRTRGLPGGDAVTVWWVIFNHPEKCTAGMAPLRCGEADLFNPAVAASVQNAGGHVVGGSGNYALGPHLAEGDTSECAFGAFLCAGLIDAQEADIHLVVRSHGPALAEFLPGQISSFGVGCANLADFGLPPMGPNICTDLQFTAHETV
jgi:hypothetical protein